MITMKSVSARILMAVAAANYLEVMTVVIVNAYLNANTKEIFIPVQAPILSWYAL